MQKDQISELSENLLSDLVDCALDYGIERDLHTYNAKSAREDYVKALKSLTSRILHLENNQKES